MLVVASIRNSMLVDTIYTTCSVTIDILKMKIDQIPQRTMYFDGIIGMNWLLA